jgi:hypothetical protein
MRQQMRGRVATSVAALATIALVLTGCTDHDSAPAPTGDADALGLSGPWAQEFADQIASSDSAYEKEILGDGIVTDAEFADAHHRVEQCLGDSGYTINYFAGGGFEVGRLDGTFPDGEFPKSNKALEACEAKFDQSITYLYQNVRRNPDKLDDAAITVPCLRKAGLVGKDYTERQWQHDYDEGVLPFDEWSEAATQCKEDPLDLWRKQ